MANRWLHGPVWDVLLGCGVLYFVFFIALGLSGPALTGKISLAGLAIVAIMTGAPHYGATLLRVYDQRESRRRYAVLAVWFTVALVFLFDWGTELGPLLALYGFDPAWREIAWIPLGSHMA